MIDKNKVTITLSLHDYEKMQEQISILTKAADDKSVVIARYYGYEYHIVNGDKKLNELIEKINSMGVTLK